MEFDPERFAKAFAAMHERRMTQSDSVTVADYNAVKTFVKSAQQTPTTMSHESREITLAMMFAAYLKLKDTGVFNEDMVAGVCCGIADRLVLGSMVIDEHGLKIPLENKIKRVIEIVMRYEPVVTSTIQVTPKGFDVNLNAEQQSVYQLVQERLRRLNLSDIERNCMTEVEFRQFVDKIRIETPFADPPHQSQYADPSAQT